MSRETSTTCVARSRSGRPVIDPPLLGAPIVEDELGVIADELEPGLAQGLRQVLAALHGVDHDEDFERFAPVVSPPPEVEEFGGGDGSPLLVRPEEPLTQGLVPGLPRVAGRVEEVAVFDER